MGGGGGGGCEGTESQVSEMRREYYFSAVTFTSEGQGPGSGVRPPSGYFTQGKS